MDQRLGTSIEHIEGVILHPLKVIGDDRGNLMHMLRNDSPLFDKFGEIYFSETKPGVVKAWKRHSNMTQRFAVPVGKMKIVICDNRNTSSTFGKLAECFLGRPDAYSLLVIPPMLWYGFQCVSATPAIIANCSDMPHDPKESEHMDLHNNIIHYDW